MRKFTLLIPFIDKEGILRIVGRLSQSLMTFAQKHPIILLKSSVIARLIEHEYKVYRHSGSAHTRNMHTGYIVRGKTIILARRRSRISLAYSCCRAYSPPGEYVMGNLPEAQVT